MTTISLELLPTDYLMYFLLLGAIIVGCWTARQPHLRAPWQHVFKNKWGMVALVILNFFIVIGLLDSLHFQITKKNKSGQYTQLQQKTMLDCLFNAVTHQQEKTYSKPFAIHAYQKTWVTTPNGNEIQTYPKLQHTNAQLKNDTQHISDIVIKIFLGFLGGFLSFSLIAVIWVYAIKRRKNNTDIAWKEAILTFGFLWILIWILAVLAHSYHILGTDKIGQDVFYQTVKSIHTGLLIGTLTTIFMLPFALFFGTIAGYFGGLIDDIIQYFYTTLSSIPGVLLITAMILVIQVFIENHPSMFPTMADRADARLLALCFILGITSWASLCRLLRAETLKLREQPFVTASITMGARRLPIILKHIIPNVMHIVLITIVLDFSGLVLAEAILSYVGVGVDPTTISWGNIINTSRLELAREPIVWWPLLAALTFMFFLVLSANIFADAVRDAFDPRAR